MIMLQGYAVLFREPGLARALLASIVGRLPIGVATLAILMSVQAHAGSFAQSGAAAACYVFGLALLAPLLGRVMDRLGPRPVLIASAVVYPAAGLVHMIGHGIAVEINPDVTPASSTCAFCVRSSAASAMPAIARAIIEARR